MLMDFGNENNQKANESIPELQHPAEEDDEVGMSELSVREQSLAL